MLFNQLHKHLIGTNFIFLVVQAYEVRLDGSVNLTDQLQVSTLIN